MDGITERDMLDYEPPGSWAVVTAGIGTSSVGIEAHFLGQYISWDSHENARVAIAAGMQTLGVPPSPANWWVAENLDNWQTSVHDAGMYRKYGYGRGCAQISVDVRAGLIDREAALDWVKSHDHIFPETYAGVSLEEGLDRIGMKRQRLFELLDRFTDPQFAHG